MSPWLSIIGIGEDGLNGLTAASQAALHTADVVFGGKRHLALANLNGLAKTQSWSVPFSIEPVLALRDQEKQVAVLASGDPFWFGAGGTLAQHLNPGEWQVFPNISTFSLVAARLGWRLEETACVGLHAAPMQRLRKYMATGQHTICLMRDGAAVGALGKYLSDAGFGDSEATVFAAIGGPRETYQTVSAHGLHEVPVVKDPVAVALNFRGGPGLMRCPGLPDDGFHNDGQITKQPVRALTLSALAPRAGERLWDVGAGNGSIAIEWLLATGDHGNCIAIEPRADRGENVLKNAADYGVAGQIEWIQGKAPDALVSLQAPDAVFIGGGASEAMFNAIFAQVAPGTRIVANAVTLETEMLLHKWSAHLGGSLLRLEVSEALPLGQGRGWSPSRPITQWRVTA
ncbi:MAG: precorrin-6y C5,15-methyltransferase (decarboxylating) subunit CbiE [Pseudomonadota bacterium]